MAVEQAHIHIIPKPWGRTDLRPWNAHHDPQATIGEARFERAAPSAPLSTLQMKLIFTAEPLASQVHADEARARAIGLAHSTCEALYVLAASAQAHIAVGLNQQLTPTQLRASIHDGTIGERVQWQAVRTGDSTFVPPDTIHAIGAGLVIVEIRPRTSATFRRFDYGGPRKRHVDVAVAGARPPAPRSVPRKLTAARTLLVTSPHFVLERIMLAPGVVRELDPAAQTWLFILAGAGRVDSIELDAGKAVFLESEPARIEVGANRLHCLVAYARCTPAPYLLRRMNSMRVSDPVRASSETSLQLDPVPVSGGAPAEAAP